MTTTSSNETEICDNALKKMETKLEQLIVNKLETKLEKLLQQNLETKRLERLTKLINKTADPEIVRQLSERYLRRCSQENKNEAGKNQRTDPQR